jgi:hypothetical protein
VLKRGSQGCASQHCQPNETTFAREDVRVGMGGELGGDLGLQGLDLGRQGSQRGDQGAGDGRQGRPVRSGRAGGRGLQPRPQSLAPADPYRERRFFICRASAMACRRAGASRATTGPQNWDWTSLQGHDDEGGNRRHLGCTQGSGKVVRQMAYSAVPGVAEWARWFRQWVKRYRVWL